MELRIITLPGGKLQIFVDGEGVSVEDAARATEQVIKLLSASGVPVERTSAIEQHKNPGATHVHEIRETHHH